MALINTADLALDQVERAAILDEQQSGGTVAAPAVCDHNPRPVDGHQVTAAVEDSSDRGRPDATEASSLDWDEAGSDHEPAGRPGSDHEVIQLRVVTAELTAKIQELLSQNATLAADNMHLLSRGGGGGGIFGEEEAASSVDVDFLRRRVEEVEAVSEGHAQRATDLQAAVDALDQRLQLSRTRSRVLERALHGAQRSLAQSTGVGSRRMLVLTRAATGHATCLEQALDRVSNQAVADAAAASAMAAQVRAMEERLATAQSELETARGTIGSLEAAKASAEARAAVLEREASEAALAQTLALAEAERERRVAAALEAERDAALELVPTLRAQVASLDRIAARRQAWVRSHGGRVRILERALIDLAVACAGDSAEAVPGVAGEWGEMTRHLFAGLEDQVEMLTAEAEEVAAEAARAVAAEGVALEAAEAVGRSLSLAEHAIATQNEAMRGLSEQVCARLFSFFFFCVS